MDGNAQPIFNDIRIDLRGGKFNTNQYDRGSVPNRISIYSEYPQVRPTSPLSIRTHTSNPQVPSSTTLATRRQQFYPQAPPRPIDWRCLGIFCIIIFFPFGLFAHAYARQAQSKFRAGFITDSYRVNTRALIFCIISIICAVALFVVLLFGSNAYGSTNG